MPIDNNIQSNGEDNLPSMQRPSERSGKTAPLLAILLWTIVVMAGQHIRIELCRADDKGVDTATKEPWQISADRIDYDQILDEYLARGDVRITRQGRILTANSVRLNQKTGDALADGNVRLTSGSDVLTGSRLELNLNSETGVLSDGTVFISKNHLYLSGRKILKTGPQTYAAEHIKITSCDGPDPAWDITGQDFKVTIEGYGSAKNTALWAGKIPILYSPYLFFPVKLKRQSGLLMPEFGYSDRKGTQYQQPLYWAIDDSSDATFYSHYMSERGIRNGIEYRYVLDEQSMGAIFVEGFEDYKIDNGQDDTSRRWGYEDDNVLRENKDRYWFRMKHNQNLGMGVTAKLDLDVVSDQDYLHEFKSGYDGFDATQAYFAATFGRGLDDYNDPIRLNQLNLNRIWTQYSFNANLQWYDNVIKRRQGEDDNTLQQLPYISFDGVKGPLGSSPFYYDLTSSYTHFYRIKGTRGHRADLYPRVYYPFDFMKAVSIEPSVGLRQTAWQVDTWDSPSDHDRDTLYRSIYDFRVDLSTEFYRIFDFHVAGNDLLKHTITPEVVYEFIPEEDQSDYPEFDPLDRIEKTNLITYGFTNTFTSRASGSRDQDTNGYRYTEFLRFKLSQSFDINKHNEGDPEPFSNIMAELEMTPGRYVNVDSDAQWSVYDTRFESLNTSLTLWDLRGDRLTADYRYTRETSETSGDGVHSVRLWGEVKVDQKWALRAGIEENLYNHLEIERLLGVTYRSNCWGMMLDYSIQEGNQSYAVVFNLAGLGDIGD